MQSPKKEREDLLHLSSFPPLISALEAPIIPTIPIAPTAKNAGSKVQKGTPKQKLSQKERKRQQKQTNQPNNNKSFWPASEKAVKPSHTTETRRASFSSIQKQQHEEKRQIEEKTRKRSLVDIQTEELVIQAWREYYGQLGMDNWEPPPGWSIQ